MSAADAPDRPPAWARPSAEVEPGAVLGAGTRVWRFSHVAAGARIGADCVIGQNVAIGPGVVVGDRCKIQNNVSLYAGVTLEDGVFCGPSCVFTNVTTPRAEISRKAEFRPTRVGRGATIGANATIVCGNDLGAWCPDRRRRSRHPRRAAPGADGEACRPAGSAGSATPARCWGRTRSARAQATATPSDRTACGG